MVWFKVDDTLAFHRKTVAAGNAAMGLWLRAGSWCADQLTDGHVPDHMIPSLGNISQAKRLVSTGLWMRVDGGYRFHQWNDEGRQPTRAEVEAKRAAEAEKKRRWREARSAQRAAESRGESPGVSPGDSLGDAPQDTPVSSLGDSRGESRGVSRSSRPDPTRPDPDSPTESLGEGRVTEVNARAQDAPLPPPPEPPLCLKHTGWDRDDVPACRACASRRTRWQTDVAEHDRAVQLEQSQPRPQCRLHRGQDEATCRSCAADRKAAPEPAEVAS